MPLPEQDEMFNTKGKMLQDITVHLAAVLRKKSFLMILRQELLRILNRRLVLRNPW
mgnify:FL=1